MKCSTAFTLGIAPSAARKSFLFAAALIFHFAIPALSWELINSNLPGPITEGRNYPIDTDGTRLYVLGSTGVYVSQDNGNSFSPVNTVAGTTSYTLTNINHRFIKYVNGSMWVGSDPGSAAFNLGHATLHRLAPGQTEWQKNSAGFPADTVDNQADDIAYDSTTGTYYVGAGLGGIFVSDDGINWQQRTTGLGGIGLPASVVAFGGQAFAFRPLAQVHRTLNRGSNWTAMVSHSGTSGGYLLEKNGRIMFSTTGGTVPLNGFYYSDNNGDTWTFLRGLRGTANLSSKDGLIYAGGSFGGNTETFDARYGFKFSATDGVTWDNLPTNGLPSDPTLGFDVNRVVRQGNYLFLHQGTNLYRLDVAAYDFTPLTQIGRDPLSTNRLVGQALTLDVLAGGTNLTYQWRKGGVDLVGATNRFYSVSPVSTNEAGAYTVVVTGSRGSVTSAVANVNVGVVADGRVDITYNSAKTGGQLYLAQGNFLLAVNSGNLYRLNPDGVQVANRSISGGNFFVNLVDSANRLVLGNTLTVNRLRRVYSTNLVDDATFNQPTFNGQIQALAELPGRGYLVGGNFTAVTNAGISTNAVNYFCLIGYNGQLDSSFPAGSGPNANVANVAVNSTNIFVAGNFSQWNGAAVANFVKLGTNGLPAGGFTSPAVGTTWLKPVRPGKIFVLDTSSRPKLLGTDGALDSGFNSANAAFSFTTLPVKAVAAGESNKTYAAGSFSSYGGASVGKIVRLQSNGTLDTNFFSQAPSVGDFVSAVYDSRGYLHVTLGNSFANLQGQSYGVGPYRLFAGTELSALTAWKAQYSFSPGLDSDGADADGDSLPNVFEYYFGSNPTNAASGSLPAYSRVNVSGSEYPAISFVRSQTATGVTLLPEASSVITFADSLGVTVHSVVNLGGGLERVTIRSNVSTQSQAPQFLRLKLSIP